ncbi:unnamed protein product [Gadus morhua 'NCC']
MNRQSGQEPNGHIGYKHFRKLFKCLTGIRSGFKAYFTCSELLSIPLAVVLHVVLVLRQLGCCQGDRGETSGRTSGCSAFWELVRSRVVEKQTAAGSEVRRGPGLGPIRQQLEPKTLMGPDPRPPSKKSPLMGYTKMKTATNIYIFNLALADALVLATLPFQGTDVFLGFWPFGNALCKAVVSIDYYNMFTSTFTLTVMSMDRYVAVCHPVKALDMRTPHKAKVVNICVWVLASAIGVPAMVMGDVEVDMSNVECIVVLPEPRDYWDPVFGTCVFLFSFLIPVAIISICYSLMVKRLRSVRILSGSKEKDRNLRRITRMVLVVVAAFVVCWTPVQIMALAQSLGFNLGSLFTLVLMHFCIALGYVNSSLNPVLYAFLDENFKRCFREFCHPSPFRLDTQQSGRMRSIAREVAAAYSCKGGDGGGGGPGGGNPNPA